MSIATQRTPRPGEVYVDRQGRRATVVGIYGQAIAYKRRVLTSSGINSFMLRFDGPIDGPGSTKACPFCGAGNGVQHKVPVRGREWAWRCAACGARGPQVERDGSDGPLIDAWNRRAADATTSPASSPRR